MRAIVEQGVLCMNISIGHRNIIVGTTSLDESRINDFRSSGDLDKGIRVFCIMSLDLLLQSGG